MAQFEKHFTVAEARAALPDLRRRLLRVQELLAEIRARRDRTGEPPLVILRGNGKGPVVLSTDAQQAEAQNLIEQIAAEGIQIKDVERGLVDFPHFRDGDPTHEVFLCWQFGEDTIEFWHEIEDGFAGRTRL